MDSSAWLSAICCAPGAAGCTAGAACGLPTVRLLWTLVTPATWPAIDSASSLEASLDTVPESVTSPWMVAAVIRSLFSALEASRACTTSISICPSVRWSIGGAVTVTEF